MLAFRKPVEIVDEINQQKFLAQGLRERRLHAKIEPASAQQEIAMPLVIVDDGLVVKLCRSNTQAVVGIGRDKQEPMILQEGLDQVGILRRSFPENRLLRIKVESARQLGERAIAQQLSEVAVNGIRPVSKVRTPVNPAGLQMPLEFFEPSHGRNIGKRLQIASFFIEITCMYSYQDIDITTI